MKNIIFHMYLVALLISITSCSSHYNHLSFNSILSNQLYWIKSDIDWKLVPPEIAQNRYYATSEILYFHPNGGFLKLDCWLNKYNDKLVISRGDPFVVYVGSWRIENDSIVVKYKMAYSLIKFVDSDDKSSEEVKSVLLRNNKEFLFLDSIKYIPYKNPEKDYIENFLLTYNKDTTT